jgi:AraC family transcriptional regulator
MSSAEIPSGELPSPRSSSASVRKLMRLSELGALFRPSLSTAATGCIGFEAEVHKIDGRIEAGPFSLPAISVVFIHRGELSADFESASMIHNFTNGGLLILPAGSSAAFKVTDADLTVIYLRPDQLAGIELDRYSQLEIVPQIDPMDLQMTFLVGCVREELQSGMLAGPLFLESLGLAMARHICARYSASPSSKRLWRGGLSSRQLDRAQKTMMASLYETVPLTRLAEDAGLSSWYFCRAFKQSTGLSPHQWMRERRLDQARKLLADEHLSLTSIAIDLGYASLSHFSATFKQATGISPTRYRRGLTS